MVFFLQGIKKNVSRKKYFFSALAKLVSLRFRKHRNVTPFLIPLTLTADDIVYVQNLMRLFVKYNIIMSLGQQMPY